MATGKDASRIAAQRRWREGILSRDTLAQLMVRTITPLEHQMVWRRHGAIKLEPERAGLPWARKRRDPTTRVSVPRTSLPAGVPLPTEPRAGGGGQGGVPLPVKGCASEKNVSGSAGQTSGRQGYWKVQGQRHFNSGDTQLWACEAGRWSHPTLSSGQTGTSSLSRCPVTILFGIQAADSMCVPQTSERDRRAAIIQGERGAADERRCGSPWTRRASCGLAPSRGTRARTGSHLPVNRLFPVEGGRALELLYVSGETLRPPLVTRWTDTY